MYLHRPSGEYRLLLCRRSNSASIVGGDLLPERRIGCYVLPLGSDQPMRYIGGAELLSALLFNASALVRDSLHWSPVHKSTLVTVFDTAAELFRQMSAPIVPTESYMFEMDGKLGIFGHDDAMEAVDIWLLPNYEDEVWEHKYRLQLPVTEIRRQFGGREGQSYVSVVSMDGVVCLLLNHGQWLLYISVDGELVDSFHCDGLNLYACGLRLKQTLVPHSFFTALEDYTVNAPLLTAVE